MALGELRSRLARVWVTLAYAAALAVVSTTLDRLGPGVRERVIAQASTNLHNLSHGHVGTLLGSAFVVDAGPMVEWLPGLICLLGVAELTWRSARLLAAFTVGHVGATVVVAGGLALAVEFGWLPGTVTRAADVGMSYGAISVLGALTPAIPRQCRPTWVGWWLAVGVAAVAGGTDFTNVGHVVALLLGMAVATRFGTPRQWTPGRVGLLAVGSAFGYLILVDGDSSPIAPTAAGLAGAVLGTLVIALRQAVRTRSSTRTTGPTIAA